MNLKPGRMGVKGIVAAVALAAVAVFVAPNFGLTFAPHSVLLPVLSVSFGYVAAGLSAALTAALLGSMGAWGALCVIGLRSILPGMASAWLARRRMPYFRKLGYSVLANAIGALLAAGSVWLQFGSGQAYVEELARDMASDQLWPLSSSLYEAVMAGYINAGTIMEIAGAGGMTAASAAWYIQESMSMLLPASVCVSAALTGLLASALPMRQQAKRGETDKETYVPLEKWYVPNRWILALLAAVVVFVLVYGSGAESAGIAAQVFVSLTSLSLAVQGAAGLCSLMKRQDVSRGKRTAIIVLLALFGGVLQIAGIGRTLFGSRGIIQKLREKMERDDDDDERGE